MRAAGCRALNLPGSDRLDLTAWKHNIADRWDPMRCTALPSAPTPVRCTALPSAPTPAQQACMPACHQSSLAGDAGKAEATPQRVSTRAAAACRAALLASRPHPHPSPPA